MRRLAALVFATSAVVVWTSSCGDGAGNAPVADAGSDGPRQDSQAPCPTTAPPNGSSCAAPEGTTCAFGACGGYATCSLGQWRVSPTVPGVICPTVEPATGDPCPPCFPSGKTCTYVSTTCGDPTPTGHTAKATCGASGWVLELGPCPPVADGGALDAGNDSGNDAGDAALD